MVTIKIAAQLKMGSAVEVGGGCGRGQMKPKLATFL